MKPSSIEFKTYLKARWQEIYGSPDSKFIFSGDLEHVQLRKQGSIFLKLNESLKKKKPAVDVKLQTVISNFDGTKFNFNQGIDKQLLFYVNFDNEQVVTREAAVKETERFLDGDPDEAGQETENHPLYVNAFPVCRNHSLLIVFPEEELPQVIGEDVILLVLNLFKLSPDLMQAKELCSMGYNSLGAGASVNHLHLHLMYAEDLLEGQAKELPLAHCKRKVVHKTSLINPKEQLNMYSVGVVIEQMLGDIKGYVLSPLDPKAEQSAIYSSLAFVFGLIVNELLEQNIPHNAVMLDAGNTIYIMPRKFSTETNRTAFLEMSGVFSVKSAAQFQQSEEQCRQQIKEIQLDSLETTTKRILKHLAQYI